MAEKKTLTVKVLNMAGEEVGSAKLKSSVFGVEVNEQVMFDAVVVDQANQRQATAKTKKRAEVSGGGKKPFRQKGTGRARAGSTRSPVWVGGGTVWGPDGRQSYKLSQNKKEHQLALKSALTLKVSDSQLRVIDKIACKGKKTADYVKFLNAVKAEGKVLVVVDELDENIVYSARNVAWAHTVTWDNVSVLDLLHVDTLVASQDALKKIEEALD
ncbi:MAG: 50S ribosomal protein L4 [Bacilli bacterium]|nr:50S ribosomal protein L4 [Bacilli bacterium]